MNWQEWRNYAEDEQHWVNHDERGLLKAEYVEGFVLRLRFEEELDVSIYELDFAPLFVANNPGGLFAPLRAVERFRLVAGDYALVWLNRETGQYDEAAIDIAPECIRFFCEQYGRLLKPAGDEPARNLVPA
jgi:hypothetical protein